MGLTRDTDILGPAKQTRPASRVPVFDHLPDDGEPGFDCELETMANVQSPLPHSPTSKPNRLLESIKQSPGRHPSPQPAHLSYPKNANGNGNGHRVLRSATVGYIAPAFEGKQEQIAEGECIQDRRSPASWDGCLDGHITNSSQ